MIYSILKTVLKKYDLRTGTLELRSKRKPFGWTYSLYVGTACVESGLEGVLRRLVAEFTCGMDKYYIGTIQVVSKAMEWRRNRRPYVPPYAYDLHYDAESMSEYEAETEGHADKDISFMEVFSRSFPRSLETVSELLPDYRISLKDLYPEVFPDRRITVQLTEEVTALA